MIQPDFLKEGDKIAIVAPAKRMLNGELEEAIELIKSWKLVPVLGKNIYAEYDFGYRYAGTDEMRTEDFQWALDDYEIKAIWCARGGYGSVKIIDELDLTEFTKNPKWIIGYSDITVFHNHFNRLGYQTLHAVTAKKLADTIYHPSSYQSVYDSLFGKDIHHSLTNHPYNKEGETEGELIGGNLSIVYSLLGSDSAIINPSNKILFLEDWFENWYAVDRMLMNLKRNGILKQVKGVILGSFTHMDTEEENAENFNNAFDPKTYDVIHQFTKELSVPVAFNFPAGHTGHNVAMKMGAKVQLKISSNSVNLHFIENQYETR